jgi:phosphomannomutase
MGSPFGVSITASHNPAPFNGIKIKTSIGASAGPEVTRLVEQAIPEGEVEPPGERGIPSLSFRDEHRRRLLAMVDLEKIRSSGLRVRFDAMHGSAASSLSEMLAGGTISVETLRGDADPLFGGNNPEPLAANLPDLGKAMASGGADIGLATDGDGDRIGAYDEKGRFVTPLQIAPLLALGLIDGGRTGEICKTYANTIWLDRIAERKGLPFSVHPIGFKYIAERMQAGGFLIGGEESGGIGIAGYLPERDGLLISLVMLEVLATRQRPLSELLSGLARDYGELHYSRRDIPCAPERGRELAESLRASAPSSIGTMRVTGLDDLDGIKLLFGDQGWILVRPSGTEPVLRVYCEAPDEDAVEAALDEMVERVAE